MIGSIARLILGNWQVAAGILALLLLSHTTAYCTGRSDGREGVKAELRAAEARSEVKAAEARSEADTKAAERAEAEAEVINDQLKAIEKAEANGENPLDSLF